MASRNYIGIARLRPCPAATDNRRSLLPDCMMIGRLFRLFLLLCVIYLAIRWLLNHRQRQAVHEFVRALAIALIVSSLLMLGLFLFGIRL
ncbi:protein MIGRI [Vogesella oryzae]|uniref:protein MIGRI n=1 Tax=Vogesella oryzae TaxID=1735285 RepID=UPI001FEA71E6|nr:hypothetical protein [Vogesella oryzae]